MSKRGKSFATSKRVTITLAALTLLMGTTVGLAAPVVSPAEVVNRNLKSSNDVNSYYWQERVLKHQQEQKQAAVVHEEPVAAVEEQTNQPKFDIKKIDFTSSEILSSTELAEIASSVEGKSVTLQDLQKMVATINELYYKKNFITAKAVLPPQKIVDGTIKIELIEGRYGQIRVEGNKNTRDGYILNRLDLEKNTLVDLKEIERTLTYFNRTNAPQLKGELLPGANVGETDCVLHVEEAPLWQTTIYTDNAGSTESGLYRIGALMVNNNLFGGNETLILNPTWTQGTLAGSIGYSQPINNHGTTITFGYSKNTLDIIKGNLKDLDVTGRSEDISVTLGQPLKVTSDLKTDAYLDIHHKTSSTDFFGNNLLDTKSNTYTLGYNVQQTLANGLWYASISGTHIKATQKDNYDHKSFSKFNTSVVRQQVFQARQILTFRGMAQLSASKELPATEQFSLGGIATVKGFKESIVSGDTGYYLGVEYSVPVAEKVNGRILLGLDHGAVQQNFENGSKQRDTLTSASIGYAQNLGKNAFAKLVLGVPLDYSDSVTAGKTRIHFYAQMNF